MGPKTKIKKIFSFASILTVFFWFISVNSFSEISGEMRSIFTEYDINGYKLSSYYPQGSHYREELDLKLKEEIGLGVNLESFLSLRYTDDTFVDDEIFSIERMYIKFTGEEFGMSLGDFYTRFSTYSLNQSLKGITLYRDFELLERIKVTGLFGVTKDRWEDLYKELDNETYTRYVAGVRIEQDVTKDIKWGLNFVNTEDDEDGSVPDETTYKAIDNKLLSIDSKVAFFDKKFKIKGEIAHSWHKSDVKANVKRKADLALNLNTDLKIGKLKLDNDYERVGTNFAAPVGSVSVDRDQFKTKLTYEPNKFVQTKVGYTTLHDNLNNQKTTTTATRVPYAELTLKPLKMRKYLKLNLSYKERRLESGDGSTTDKRTKTAYVGLRDRIKNFDLNCGYRHRRKRDDITPTNERDINAYIVGGKTRFNIFNIRILPSVQYEIEEDKQISTKDLDIYQTTRLGLSFHFPKGTYLNLRCNISDKNKKVPGLDVVRTVAKAEFRTYLFGDKNKKLSLKYELRDYNKENETRSYDENLFEAKFAYKF